MDPGRVRGVGAHARARPIQRSCPCHRHIAGHAGVPGQRAELGRAHQRELRARADGAAHARRQRGPERIALLAAGRAGTRARADRRRTQPHGQHAALRSGAAAALHTPRSLRVQSGPPRQGRKDCARHEDPRQGLRRGRRRGHDALPPARDGAFRQHEARAVLRRRRSAARARRPDGPHVPEDRRIDRGRAAGDVPRQGFLESARRAGAQAGEIQGPDAVRRLVAAAGLRGEDADELSSRRQLAPAARRAALRSRNARWLSADRAGVDQLRATRPPFRDRARHRQRRRGALQRGRQLAGTGDRFPDAHFAPLPIRPSPRSADTPGAREDFIAAGMEHDPLASPDWMQR